MKSRVSTYNLKAQNTCRIYVATDTHYESGRIHELDNIITEANKSHPDVIVLAGDTINYLDDINSKKSRSDLKNFFQRLSQIAPVQLGVGNHDQMHKDRKFVPEKMLKEQQIFLDFIRSIPEITLLHNQKVEIKKGINLIGITLPRDAYQKPSTVGTQEPATALKSCLSQNKALLARSGKETNILLIHSPRRFTPEIVNSLKGTDYIITGHMHQGCVPFGLDEKLPGTVGIIAPGYAPFPTRSRHTYPKYSDKLIVLPAYKTFSGHRRHWNACYPQSHTILSLTKQRAIIIYSTSVVYILEDDDIMAGCIAGAIKKAGKSVKIKHFKDAISAIQNLDSNNLPKIIFLDILLTGPDGFTFLNELASYDDTNKIPIVIISSLDFTGKDLSSYNVIGILNKETMYPADIQKFIKEYLSDAH